eukprot:CAMPEP_0176414464 /NCGR_PEP_ID=MMETSP0127-20121128/5271_1 /TAXON_ID=938130 /ORGANISM="Platyophrya macrostoma, Strain WH" /LENGTH=73 /DNA_ID=CAMNT_0017794363 /DNA_START=38 /DNA_END=259 /DNA_ORIENTATION=+
MSKRTYYNYQDYDMDETEEKMIAAIKLDEREAALRQAWDKMDKDQALHELATIHAAKEGKEWKGGVVTFFKQS